MEFQRYEYLSRRQAPDSPSPSSFFIYTGVYRRQEPPRRSDGVKRRNGVADRNKVEVACP